MERHYTVCILCVCQQRGHNCKHISLQAWFRSMKLARMITSTDCRIWWQPHQAKIGVFRRWKLRARRSLAARQNISIKLWANHLAYFERQLRILLAIYIYIYRIHGSQQTGWEHLHTNPPKSKRAFHQQYPMRAWIRWERAPFALCCAKLNILLLPQPARQPYAVCWSSGDRRWY